MQSEMSLKKEFFKKWLNGLQNCNLSKDNYNISTLLERKKLIKLSANLAMASANHDTRKSSWSNALLSKATKDPKTRFLAKRILGRHHVTMRSELRKAVIGQRNNKKTKMKMKKNISRKNRNREIAKRLVKKRREILRRIVPGGESMDEFSLIKEALDYIVSLRVQVDVMQNLANSFSNTINES